MCELKCDVPTVIFILKVLKFPGIENFILIRVHLALHFLRDLSSLSDLVGLQTTTTFCLPTENQGLSLYLFLVHLLNSLPQFFSFSISQYLGTRPNTVIYMTTEPECITGNMGRSSVYQSCPTLCGSVEHRWPPVKL